MNKREFVAGGVGAIVAAPLRARTAPGAAAPASLQALMERTQRLPDLVEAASAATFEAYIGERFSIIAGPDTGAELVVSGVERVARCASTEQFTVSFLGADVADGVQTLAHATGQRLTLHLEPTRSGCEARFNLLA